MPEPIAVRHARERAQYDALVDDIKQTTLSNGKKITTILNTDVIEAIAIQITEAGNYPELLLRPPEVRMVPVRDTRTCPTCSAPAGVVCRTPSCPQLGSIAV